MTSPGKQFIRFALPAVALLLVISFFISTTAALAQDHEIVLEFTPAQTSIEFALEDPLHTVHGAFNLKHGQVHYTPGSGEVRGEIVVDTTSGHSGSSGRDGRMHREILESAKYPEIIFHPRRVEGKVESHGTSRVQVHGIFTIHGADHEITIPVQVEMTSDHWTATSHFDIPYVNWGIKNPSNFFLHVSQSVTIDIHASGAIPGALKL